VSVLTKATTLDEIKQAASTDKTPKPPAKPSPELTAAFGTLLPNASTAVDASQDLSAGSGGGVVVTPPMTPAAGDVPETNFGNIADDTANQGQDHTAGNHSPDAGNMVGQDCPHGGPHDFSDGEACRNCSEPMPADQGNPEPSKPTRKPTEFEQLRDAFLAAPLVAQVAMAAWVIEVWQRDNTEATR